MARKPMPNGSTVMDLTDAGLREQARQNLVARYIESAGQGYWPTPPVGTRWNEWLRAIEALIPTVAESYLALRDAARAEQREQDAKIIENLPYLHLEHKPGLEILREYAAAIRSGR